MWWCGKIALPERAISSGTWKKKKNIQENHAKWKANVTFILKVIPFLNPKAVVSPHQNVFCILCQKAIKTWQVNMMTSSWWMIIIFKAWNLLTGHLSLIPLPTCEALGGSYFEITFLETQVGEFRTGSYWQVVHINCLGLWSRRTSSFGL